MKRPSPARRIALCAVLSALCVAILAVGSLIDVLDFSLALLAGMVVLVAQTEFSRGYGWFVFAVSATLSFLLPVKTPALLFTLFFGWYPLVRFRLVPLKKWLRILIKIVLFNALVALFVFASVFLLGAEREPWWLTALTFVLVNLVFALYEPSLDRVTRFYVLHLQDRLKRFK